MRYAIHLREEHVDGHRETEFARRFGQSLTQRLRERGELLSVVARVEQITWNADDRGTRGRLALTDGGGHARGAQGAHHLRPARSVGE